MVTKEIISPEAVKTLGKKKIDENIKFRTFLKGRADSDILDDQFKKLHEKYFKNYDCFSCRNCCKELGPEINVQELEELSAYLELPRDEFIDSYLREDNGSYSSKNSPCDFLCNNECILNDRKPMSCKDYPYTDKEERLYSLLGVIQNAEICPIVYEIIEELKEIYNFKSYN